MPIRTWSLDDTVGLLDVSGRLDAETGAALREAVDRTLLAGQRQLLLNLLDVCTLDAAGLGALAHARAMVGAVGGELKLVVRSSTVIELLERTGLLGLFLVFPTEAEAIATFDGLLEKA